MADSTTTAAAAAAERSDELTQRALLEDMERHYVEIKEERDALFQDLQKARELATSSSQAQISQQEWEQKCTQQKHETDLALNKIKALEEERTQVAERMDRRQAEGDALREEISRLSKSNAELSKTVSNMEAQSRVQENEAIPLFREKQRLQTELDSLQAHSNWLNQELEAKSKDYLRLKQEAHDRSLQFHLQLDQTTADKDAAEARLEAAEQMERDLQEKIQQLSNDLLSAKQELSHTEETSRDQVREEQRLVQVQKEHLDRWQDRYNDVVRQNESLKSTAVQAMELSQKEMEEQRAELEANCQQLLAEQKAKFEEKMLSLPSSTTAAVAITAVRREIAIGEEEEPMNLTQVYGAYEETKLALKKEEIQRKHWELQFQQVQKEIEDIHPRMRRQMREYEMAVEKVQDYEQRLEHAIGDRDAALMTAKEARQESSSLRQVVMTRKAEAQALGKQVQALLASRTGASFDTTVPTTVQQMQQQNQQILGENNRLERTVAELKAQLDADELTNKLQKAEEELATLNTDRSHQEELVDKLATERDLYKCLVAEHDSNLLGSEAEESNAVEMAKKQSARSRKLEQLNTELEGKLASARSAEDEANRKAEVASERLVRYEEQAALLRKTINDLERELSSAKGETARAVSSAEYHQDKSQQLDASLERARSELSHLNESKNALQKINTELQQSLANAKSAQARAEDEKRIVESNLRLAKTQVETSKAAETRALEENNQLRSEIARQGGISESVRRIEASLTAKSESELETMKDDLERMTAKLAEEESKHSTLVDNLNAKIQETESRLQDLESSKQQASADAVAADKLLLKANAEVKELASKCSTLEAQLNSAKKRLGENDGSEDPEVSMQARINDLVSQLETATAELASLKDRAKNFEKMSKNSEEALVQATESIGQLKKQKDQECLSLKQQLENMKKQDAAKQEIIKELTVDLAGHREEKEQVVSKLQAEINTLKTEMTNKDKEGDAKQQAELAMKMDMEAIRSEAALAHNNYERELQMHSQARTLLREATEKAEQESKERSEAENRADTAEKELEHQRVLWQEEKKSVTDEMKIVEKSLEEARAQNKALHAQLETLGSMVEKANAPTADSTEGNPATGISDSNDLQRVISELRETVRFVRSENEMLMTQLDTAKRTAERERSSASVTKRSLDEARAELKIVQADKSSDGDPSDLSSKLQTSEDQVKILSDSNKLLREETETLQKKVTSMQAELSKVTDAAKPAEDLQRELNMKVASLQAEKESLSRDLDSWKQRVTSLVSKFNQIDPEEHRKLQEKVSAMEQEKESTDAWKKTTEEENTRIRTIAKNLNLKSKEQKTLIEKQQAEIEKLTKSSSADSAAAKERNELQKTVAKMKKDAESAKTELEGSNSQNNRLRETLRKFQTTIRELKSKEKKLTAELAEMKASVTVPQSSTAPPEKESKAVAPSVVEKSQVTLTPSDSQATLTLPKVPEGGFTFGPGDKKVTQPTAKKGSALRGDAAVFTPKHTAAESSTGKTARTEEPTAAKPDAPAAKKRKTTGEAEEKPQMRRMSGEKKEMSIKEKLFEKKRKLEEAKQRKAEAEKRQLLAKAASAEKPEKKAKIEPAKSKADKPASLEEAGNDTVALLTKPAGSLDTSSGQDNEQANPTISAKPEEAAKSDIKQSPEPSSETSTKGEPAKALGSSPFGGTGASAPTTFGQSSSILSGSAPTFGSAASTTSAGASTGFGSSFLNMKPPGSSSANPSFSFGSSSSITLPTPAQPLAAAASPFGAFGSGTAFGGTFGSPPVPALASPLFGVPAEKDGDEGKKAGDAKSKDSSDTGEA